MGKFKPVRAKRKGPAAPPGGLPCVIILITGIILIMFFLYFVMRNANG